ncbi:hypothetical protein ACFX1Q_000347 [Malus domestica]
MAPPTTTAPRHSSSSSPRLLPHQPPRHSSSSSPAATSPCTVHSPFSLLILAEVASLCQNVIDGLIPWWVWVSWIEVAMAVL